MLLAGAGGCFVRHRGHCGAGGDCKIGNGMSIVRVFLQFNTEANLKARISALVLGFGVVLGLVGCRNTIEGNLTVDKAFIGKAFQNLPCSGEGGEPCYTEKDVQINPGSYKTQINFNNRTEFEVQIKAKNTTTLKFRLPSDLNIPENGTFTLSPRQSGQPFNLVGIVETESRRSQVFRERESCTVERWEQECYITPQGRVCHNVLRTYPGFRDAEFYFIDTDQRLAVHLAAPQDASVFAVFNGEKSTRDRRYTYQGPCW